MKTSFGYGRDAQPLELRFWKRVNKTRGCWLWMGHLYNGYGRLGVKVKEITKLRRAHRVSWELTYGKIPGNKDVLHKCDVRNCVKPSHLFLGNDFDNQLDMRRKGRWKPLYGDRNGHTKISDALVRQLMRKKFPRSGPDSRVSWARKLNVSYGTINRVIWGKRKKS